MEPLARILLAGALLVAVSAATSTGESLSPSRQVELRNMVVQDCGSCHGLTLKGGLGKPLLPANLAAFSDESVALVILDGVGGTPMPPWRGLVNEVEALWIAQLLKKGVRQ